jgi:hypothetical protein
MISGTHRSTSVALSVIAIAAICALMLALPGQTVTTKYLNDLFIFLDGVHRIHLGQIPNRDFHTALGPLVYYVPALGYWLSGSFGGSMPIGMALLLMVIAASAAQIVSSRLRPAIALPLALCLLLVAAVPINLGENINALSFAMFYNRVGWAALGFLLVMYVQPVRHHRFQDSLDAACAAVLVILMLYIKISYGIVGIGFLIFQSLASRRSRWALLALGLVVISCLAIELVWKGTRSHIADLMLAGEVSGSLKSLDEMAQVLFRNLADFVLFGVFAGLALWRTRNLRDFLFFGFCAGSGYLLITQNYQDRGVMTLAAGAAVAAELVARTDSLAADKWRASATAGVQLLFLGFVLPGSLHNAAALGLHTGLAALNRGEAAPLPNFGEVKLAHLWNEEDHAVFSRYFASIKEGARSLSNLRRERDHVLVLDFVGPFSAGLGLPAPRGDSTWHHWGRTVNEDNFLPADILFRDVRVVMEPKWPVDSATAEGLKAIYGAFIEDRYELAQETAEWKVYVLRAPPAETVSRYRGFVPDDPDDKLLPSGG